MTQPPVPILLDTDIGDDIDDLYAVALAVRHPGLRLLAVTTVHGDTQHRARLAAKGLRLAGAPGVPVGAGIELPPERRRRGQTRPDPRAGLSHGEFVQPGDPEAGAAYPDAQVVLAAALAAAPAPVVLVGIGACSNLALAAATLPPELRAKVRGVALMGGEVEAMRVEYNILCDPEGADTLFTCGWPVFLGTYFVTRQLVIPMPEMERRWGASPDPLHQGMVAATRLWFARAHYGKPGPVLYDLVPLFWAADPACVTTRTTGVRVELEGQYTRGFTVARSDGPPIQVSTGLDAPALVERFCQLIA
jgi:inosine-uridine nucleoside N-ribohydrolase